MKKISFLKEGLKNIKTVGTLTRSSRFVCQNMVSHVDLVDAKVVVELGAGDGVITKHILDQMGPDTKLFAFEVLPQMCEHLRKIDDDRLIVVEDSAEHLGDYLQQHGFEQADGIISAIPFVALPTELGFRIVRECRRVLKNGGAYVQIHYSLLAKKIYDEVFGNVNVSFVPLNIPPAFILVSQKR